jgi:hypothetical protein
LFFPFFIYDIPDILYVQAVSKDAKQHCHVTDRRQLEEEEEEEEEEERGLVRALVAMNEEKEEEEDSAVQAEQAPLNPTPYVTPYTSLARTRVTPAEEEDTRVSYEEEDTCVSSEEEDTFPHLRTRVNPAEEDHVEEEMCHKKARVEVMREAEEVMIREAEEVRLRGCLEGLALLSRQANGSKIDLLQVKRDLLQCQGARQLSYQAGPGSLVNQRISHTRLV